MTEEAEAKRVKEALDGVKNGWSGPPKVVDFMFEIGEDQTGDPEVDVTALLDENTDDAQWTSENLDPITDRVRRAVADKGIDRIVYVRYLRPSEIHHTGLTETE